MLLFLICILFSETKFVCSISTQEEWSFNPSYLQPSEQFGRAIATDGSFVFVGNRVSSSTTSSTTISYVRVYKKIASSYDLHQTLTGQTGSLFGVSVAVNGNTAVVGAPKYLDGLIFKGAVYLYEYDLRSWQQIMVIIPSSETFTSASTSSLSAFTTPAPVEKKGSKSKNNQGDIVASYWLGFGATSFGWSAAVVDNMYIAVSAPDASPRGNKNEMIFLIGDMNDVCLIFCRSCRCVCA